MNKALLSALPILFLLLFSANAFSQEYRPGFIVRIEGDTVQGLIKYRENDLNFKSCVFKQGKDSETKEYLPDEIIAYGIKSDGLFESKDIVDENRALKAFVEVLVHGNLSLYQYKSFFFLEKEKGELKPLKIKTEDIDYGGSTGERSTVTTSTSHIIQINSLTFDCPVPEKLMLKVLKKINVSDIVAVVKAYNNCKEPSSSIAYKEDKAWTALETGILIGSYTTNLNFNAGQHAVKEVNFPMSHSVIAGAYCNITSPRKSERISLHIEPFYSQERHLGYLELEDPIVSYKNDYDIKIKRLSLVSMPRYTIFKSRRLSPYFGVGISSNYILSGIGVRRLETETIIKDKRHIETTVTETSLGRNFYVAATAAAGSSFSFDDKNMFLLQFRFEKGRYVSGTSAQHADYTAHLKNNNSFYLTAAYILK